MSAKETFTFEEMELKALMMICVTQAVIYVVNNDIIDPEKGSKHIQKKLEETLTEILRLKRKQTIEPETATE
jgi:hypothetical protein